MVCGRKLLCQICVSRGRDFLARRKRRKGDRGTRVETALFASPCESMYGLQLFQGAAQCQGRGQPWTKKAPVPLSSRLVTVEIT